ncbi:hypothetical protein FDP41_007483 [Naegleria fowleri]|uniref:Tyrosine aminotransferase n=1 Tax=Naegleria fowleri TaxID=5763 RepID=A0A6A5C969_NAEFO|nr:uncharacterized protein FDP41_007483 [Naegleria fowleri]KAF0984306.1 hypothetical protein FDP41_007483 [Naegleria fowleri]
MTTNQRRETSSWSSIKPSHSSMRTVNPIRQIVDKLRDEDLNPQKKKLSLSIGDPTVFGNLRTDKVVEEAVIRAVQSGACNGYAPSMGRDDARKAVAKRCSTKNHVLKPSDVVICSGASGALDICVQALCNEGDELLIPQPGFSLYTTLAGSKGIEARYYNLKPNDDWKVDLDHVKSLITDKTRAIIVNNPSNPCGSVYSAEHISEIIQLAEEYKLPIVADEIYADMIFDESNKFVRMAELTETVPILSVGGIAKQYLVPGWRIGWICIYDKQGYLNLVRDGIQRLTTLILGANTLIQGALPDILEKVDESFYQNVNRSLKESSDYTIERVSQIKGLSAIRPQGAMYCMIGIDLNMFDDSIRDDVEFSSLLLKEESLVVLPGQCFRMKNYFRVVTCPSKADLVEAYDRLEAFCQRHLRKQ